MNLFSPAANTVLWTALVVAAGVGASIPLAAIAWARTPYAEGIEDEVSQPVKFDHRHHVRDDGIDCVYCHDGAPRSSYAGIPATSVCMGCHAQIWTTSPELAVVRESAKTGVPIHWQRVTALPDFVFFDHSAHVTNGRIGCETCHGAVDTMAVVRAVRPLTMDWCIDCHRERAPERHLDECSTCHR